MLLGCRTFHKNSEMFLAAFVASVLIEGFCTYISKSFVTTGRLVDQGVKRLQQNNRHLMEIFLPGGLDHGGDGWQLSVRIRLVHAQVRRLLRLSDDWDLDAWGTPISAAHLAFAAAVFSGLLLKRASLLGVRPSPEERQGFMQVWRYSAFLMGIPEPLLPVDEESALKMYEVGSACEPPMGFESRILAHGLINSAPLLVGKTDPKERKALAKQVYGVSRAMIGSRLADDLGYPRTRVFGVLAGIRLRNKTSDTLEKFVPALARRHQANQFSTLIALSYYDESGTNYRLPSDVYAERDKTF